MPQVWHDGTSEYEVRDMDLEDTVVRNDGPKEDMADENVKEYIDYKGDVIRVDWGKSEERGCLETLKMLVLLPLMGMIYCIIKSFLASDTI